MTMLCSSLGYLRIGVASPALRVAEVDFNLQQMQQVMTGGLGEGCRFFLFPELGLTGYSCADLFFQPLLLERARRALFELAEFSRADGLTLVAGAPVMIDGRLFNCAVFISGGRILGMVPKTYLPNTQEFYEKRWFCSSRELATDMVRWDGESIPVGTDLLFRADTRLDCVVGIELCEDAWTASPPSGELALAGANLLLNLSASPEILGKAEYRRDLVRAQSARCLAAYAYASAGPGESSTDLVFSGHSLIAEYGQVLAETERFRFDSTLAVADIDLERLNNERIKNSSFGDARPQRTFRHIRFAPADGALTQLRRPVPATPFVPPDDQERSRRCREIFSLQTTGLAKRLLHTGVKQVVIGISGGLDSTLALLVTAKAFDKLGLDRRGILALTMPGFGTTSRTRNNAVGLAQHLGVELRTISIDAAVRQHFADIGHSEEVHDITYENAQARERTQVLMDVANQVGGLVIGTGDLSELALGWCTYNGDHMSMYAVNCSVPKTLVRYLVAWCAEEEFGAEAADILRDICATPVSPELLPPAGDEISQVTEDHIGPYELHDFFLYHFVRLQFSPIKIFTLARQAFEGRYDDGFILKWLGTFCRRFFAQQFKRSCLPDGPKIGSLALSPRGDWRMPSDACAQLWLAEVAKAEKDFLP